MAANAFYLPKYSESRALVVGINKYRHVSPLIHACNDAKAVAQALIERFGFSKQNVDLLLDEAATREAILKAFLRFADTAVVNADDRVLIFFAGHGHTVSGRRGETGYLVPVDGKAGELATLIRWDELTRNADLVPAKHMLFLMDACYGGLALTRATIPPGSMRFLKDMLQRYTRQVLTAGKADEVVSDSGGTRPGHSIFTSHLLDGLEGAAADGGIITGYRLMAYVYGKVGGDPHSHQTPHFGFFDGDGDFIFDTSILSTLAPASSSSEPEPEIDVLVKAPSVAVPVGQESETVPEALKRLISSSNERIRLNDFVGKLIRQATERLSPIGLPANKAVTDEEFASRLQRYEEAIVDIQAAALLLAHWGEPEQVKLLEKILARMTETERPSAENPIWLKLACYPVLLLMYTAGISALAANRFDSLRAALLAPIFPSGSPSHQANVPVVLPTIGELTPIIDQFKKIPDMARKYVPRSEHIFKKIQPIVEDQLLLGRSYDSLFDEFEILLALTYGDLRYEDVSGRVWGPPGRFAWKERGLGGDPVYTNFVQRAKSQGAQWGPLQAGFFKGSAKRFADVADAYGRLLSQINWW